MYAYVDYGINDTGESMEGTLRWQKRRSRWEQPFSDTLWKKVHLNRSRNKRRRKWQNIKKLKAQNDDTSDHAVKSI